MAISTGNLVIIKTRVAVSRSLASELINGARVGVARMPSAHELDLGPKELEGYHFFCSLARQISARGLVYVSYIRESYDSPTNDRIRITLDRQIHGTAYDGSGRLSMPRFGVASRGTAPYFVGPDSVVLELKFDNRAPAWMFDLVKLFRLDRTSVRKFCICTEELGLVHGDRVALQRQQPLAFDCNE